MPDSYHGCQCVSSEWLDEERRTFVLSLAPFMFDLPSFAAEELRSLSACLAISRGSWFSYSFDIVELSVLDDSWGGV